MTPGQKKGIDYQKASLKSEGKSCSVLITCGHPSKDGHIEVEMSYEGDPALAAYLVESAQNMIDGTIS